MINDNIRCLFNSYRKFNVSASRALDLARKANSIGTRSYCLSPWKKRGTNAFFVQNRETYRFLESYETESLRFVGYSDEILNLRHNGWYCDLHQYETYRGVVYQLPARNGSPQYVHGHSDPCNPGSALICFTLTDDKEEAAGWADHLAEWSAEESREYYAKDMAERDTLDAKEEIKRLRLETLLLIREARGQAFTPAVCSAIKSRIAALLKERSEQFRIIEERQANFWSAVSSW